MSRKKRNPQAVELAQQIISQYQPLNIEDMEYALKYIFWEQIDIHGARFFAKTHKALAPKQL